MFYTFLQNPSFSPTLLSVISPWVGRLIRKRSERISWDSSCHEIPLVPEFGNWTKNHLSFDGISFWTCCRRCARGFGWGRWVGWWVGWWTASWRARHRQDGSTEGRPVALLVFHLTLNSQYHLYLLNLKFSIEVGAIWSYSNFKIPTRSSSLPPWMLADIFILEFILAL